MTGVRVQGDDPTDAAPPPPAESGTEPAPELSAAELAALKAAKAAKKAEKAQRKAEKARRLAAEYAQQDAESPPVAPVGPAAQAAESSTASRAPLIVAVTALVAGAAVLIVGLVVRLSGGSSAAADQAKVRDTVLLSARQDIVVLNTLDYRNVDAGLERWAAASTGTLHQQITSATAAEKKQILTGKTMTTAKVLDAAVVSLDVKDGSATLIASIELTKQPAGKAAQVERERLRAGVTRVGSTWKISSLGPVGVTLP
jgi:Mce-associated membrane protein